MKKAILPALLASSSLLAAPAWANDAPTIAVELDALADDDVAEPKAKKAKKKKAKDEDADRPQTALELASDLGLSDDDVRPDNPMEVQFLGRRLIFGGEIRTTLRGRANFELQRGRNDSDVQVSPEIKLEAIWLPTDSTVVFVSGKAFTDAELYKEGGGAETGAGAQLDNFWVLQTGLFGTPFALQIGRQRLRERREIYWDDSIDAVRLHYLGDKVTAYAGIGRPVAHFSTHGRIEPEDKGQVRAFANVDWEWTDKHHVELFALNQRDISPRYAVGQMVDNDAADSTDARLTWLGARARGCVKMDWVRRVCYWGDVMRVRGHEWRYDLDPLGNGQTVDAADRFRVDGWAFDIGLNVELPFDFKPALTIGYARGSGDAPGTPGRDGSFRQTGLHQNDAKFRGPGRFHIYGEVLRPDLSNIAIGTLALGLPIGDDAWVEGVWHSYRQPYANREIAGSRLGKDPDGDGTNLGQAWDVIFIYRGDRGWEVELTAGTFRAGPAFGDEAGKWAGLVELKVDYSF